MIGSVILIGLGPEKLFVNIYEKVRFLLFTEPWAVLQWC